MMRTRIMALSLALLLALTALAGCGGTGSSKSGDVTITYMTFSAAPDHITELSAIVAAFEKQNPGIKVQIQPVAWGDYWTRLQTAVSGGTVADTFELNYENFITYAQKGLLYDLTDMAKKDKLEHVYSSKAYQVFNYQGKQYGLVETFSTVLLFYNKDLFDKAKVAYPTANWTWKDEVEAAKRLTDRSSGVWGSFKPIQFWEFYKTIAQNGGQILDGNKVVIDSPQNIETLQYLVDRIHVHKIQPTEAEMAGMASEDLFKAGKLAMIHIGIWMFGAFKDLPFQWDIALEPGNPTKAHHFFANAVALSKDTKHPEAAYKWAKFLTGSAEAAKVRVDSGWELPAIADSKLVDGYLKQSPPASRAVVFEALKSPVVPPVIEQWNEMTDQIGRELELAASGKQTPAQSLGNAKKKLEALVK